MPCFIATKPKRWKKRRAQNRHRIFEIVLKRVGAKDYLGPMESKEWLEVSLRGKEV